MKQYDIRVGEGMRLFAFLAVLLFGCCSIIQASPVADEDLLALEEKCKLADESMKASILNQMASFVLRKDPEKALHYSKMAADWAEKNHQLPELAVAAKGKGLALMILERFEESLVEFEKSGTLFEETGSGTERARALGYSAMVLADLGKLREAVHRTEQVLVIFRDLGDKKGIAAATNNLGVYLLDLGEYQDSLKYNLEALEIEEELGRKIGIANNLNSIGNIYSRLGDHLRARDYYLRARPIFLEMDDPVSASLVISNIGATFEKTENDDAALEHYEQAVKLARDAGVLGAQANPLNNMGVILIKRGQYRMARQKFEQARNIHQKLGERADLISSYHNMAEVSLKMQQPVSAMAFLEKALEIALEVQSQSSLAMVYRLMATTAHELNRDGQAYEFQKKYTEAREAILDEQKNKAILQMESRYNLDKKEKELVLLKRDRELQRLQLSSTRQQLAIALLAAIMALSGLFWFGKRYRRLFVFWKKKNYIGHYQMGERLGGGGFGDVFKAYSIRDANMPVALKLLREESSRDPLLRKRFLQEAQVIDQLDHPNIVKVLERGETNDRLYLAMEFVDGKTLAEILAENPHLSIPFCVEVMRQLIDAVEALHLKGILHRDLKPENVMLLGADTDSPRIKLMDFDLARDLRMTPLTKTGELLGTLPYMPPERISGQLCSEKGDLYALGVILYELLTGEKPFPADTPVEVMKQVLDLEPLPASRLRSDIPVEIDSLIQSLLDKEMISRPEIGDIRLQLSCISV